MRAVFVSSTFKDMQKERDALHEYVTSVLNSELAELGESVYFGDLRWGVNTTDLDGDEGSRRVLEVCLDEIDDCRPYMIVLIGERYGWIPDGELLRSAAIGKGVEVNGEMSVTELEIEYGALLSPDKAGRVLFYFRELDKSGMTEEELSDYEAESESHREHLDALKKRITEAYPASVRRYTAKWDKINRCVSGLDGFIETVKADLLELLLGDIKGDESLPWQKRAMLSASRYFEENVRHYCCVFRKPLGLFDGTFVPEERRVRFIKGAAGTGKTALLSRFYEENTQEGAAGVVPFVLGLDKYSTTEMDYFKILLYMLEEGAGEEHLETSFGDPDPDPEVFSKIRSLMGSVDTPLHSYIDNCSFELESLLSARLLDTHITDVDFEYFNWREEKPPLFFDIAYSSEEPAVILPPWADFAETYILDEIEESEVVPFVNTLLKAKHKELAATVVNEIVGKDGARMPTYLKLVTDRLLMLDSEDFRSIREMGDGMENINRYQLALVRRLPEDVYGMVREVIEKVAQRLGEETVYRILSYLTYSSVRLSERDIEGIFGFRGCEYSALDFALTVRSLSSLIDYNPKYKSYRIANPTVQRAVCDLVRDKGHSYISSELFRFLLSDRADKRLKCALIGAASYVGDGELAELIGKGSCSVEALAGELQWLLLRHGAEYTADILTRVATEHPERDFSYILERIPTACLTDEDHKPYTELLQTIVDKLVPLSQSEEDKNINSFGAVAFEKLVLLHMTVNTSDASGLFHSFIDGGNREKPLSDRCKVRLEILYFRFIAAEAYYTMSTPIAKYQSITTAQLIGGESFPRFGEELLYFGHLFSSFALYAERCMLLDVDVSEYRSNALKAYGALTDGLGEGDTCALSADDIAFMIDTALSDKGEYSSIDYDRLCFALEVMGKGAGAIDPRLIKYLPRILTAARFSYGDDEPVYLYLRLCAYCRGVAGGAMTEDDVVYAIVQMGYAIDVLMSSVDLELLERILSPLDSFIRVALTVSDNPARTLYRIYTPIRQLLTFFDIFDFEEATRDLVEFISSLGIEDPEAPLLPELFFGSLSYRFAGGDEDRLLSLRDIYRTVTESGEYSFYAEAYSPELLYIKTDIRTPDEIAEDEREFGFGFDTDTEDGDTEDGDTEDEDDGEVFDVPDDGELEELIRSLGDGGFDLDALNDAIFGNIDFDDDGE